MWRHRRRPDLCPGIRPCPARGGGHGRHRHRRIPRTRPRRYPAAASIPTSGGSSRTSAPSSSDATGSNPSAPIPPVPSTSPRSTGCPTSRTCVTGGRPTSPPLERRPGLAGPRPARVCVLTGQPASCDRGRRHHAQRRAGRLSSYRSTCAMPSRPPAAGSAQASMVTRLATSPDWAAVPRWAAPAARPQ
jgi:hypothetical protein